MSSLSLLIATALCHQMTEARVAAKSDLILQVLLIYLLFAFFFLFISQPNINLDWRSMYSIDDATWCFKFLWCPGPASAVLCCLILLHSCVFIWYVTGVYFDIFSAKPHDSDLLMKPFYWHNKTQASYCQIRSMSSLHWATVDTVHRAIAVTLPCTTLSWPTFLPPALTVTYTGCRCAA